MSFPSKEELINDLDNSDLVAKKNAIFQVGRKGYKEAIPKLIELMKNDEDKVVRNTAARALGKIRDKSTVDLRLDALVEALNDPDYYVKSNACWSLGKLKDPRAISELSKMIDPSKRLFSMSSDAETSDSTNEQSASEKLKEEGIKYSDIILEAIKAIGNIKNSEGVPALIKALNDESDGTVRGNAALALAKIKDESAIDPLIERLSEEKYWYVRRDIIDSLKKFKTPKAMPELIKKANDMYNDVRESAIDALIAMGDPAKEELLKLFFKKPKNNQLQMFVKQKFTPDSLGEYIRKFISEADSEADKQKYMQFLSKIV